MTDPAPAKRSDIQGVVFQDGVHFPKVSDVIFGIVFFDGRNVCLVLQVRDGFIEER